MARAPRGAELLFDVISSACERSSLIVTANLPFESWTEVLGSVPFQPVITDARALDTMLGVVCFRGSAHAVAHSSMLA